MDLSRMCITLKVVLKDILATHKEQMMEDSIRTRGNNRVTGSRWGRV